MCDAQTATARTVGRVTDPTGAVIPGASVKVENVDTGVEQTVTTNAEGYYSVPFLNPGNYRVTVSSPGFQSVTRGGIRLVVDQEARLDFELRVGEVTETIDVTDSAPLLESETAVVGQVIDNKSVAEMPLNGRSAWHLSQLAGATIFIRGIGDASEIPVTSMAGSRTYTQGLFVDGGSVQKTGLSRAMAEMAPMVDALEEFKVITNNYAAEYGRSAGGVFTAVTKAGTNEFHGNVFEFFRNDAMDATHYFASTKPPLRYNQYGGTLGGPFVKNKAHFFIAYEGTNTTTGSPLIQTVPTPENRQGIFTGLTDNAGRPIQLYDPTTTRPDPDDPTRQIRDPFPNNVIPQSMFDPVSLNLIGFYPDPNQPGNQAGGRNYNVNQKPSRTQHHGTGRVDYTLSEKDKIFGRYMAQFNNRPQVSVIPEAAASGVGSNTRNVENLAHTVTGTWIHMFSPTTINDFKFSHLKQFRDIFHDSAGQDWPQKLGLQGVDPLVFPVFIPAGYMRLGTPNVFREQRGPMFQVSDSVTYMRSEHTIKAGFEFRWNGSTDEFRRRPSGQFNFGAAGTGLQSTPRTGNGFASLLLGFVTNGQVQDMPAITYRNQYYGMFVQDDWKVTPSLTLNLGLRYDIETPRTSPEDQSNAFDAEKIHPIAGMPGVVTFAGVNGVPRTLYNHDYNNIAPRFGFAWRPFGPGTVIRGGYGIFFGNRNDQGDAAAGAALGFATLEQEISPDAGQTPALLLRDGYPPYSAPGPEERTDAFGIGSPVEFFQRDRATPYSQQFNFGIQQRLSSVLLEAQYLGNLGRKLTGNHISMNQVRPELVGQPGSIQSRRPFPHFTNVTILNPLWGMSSYHALLIRAEKRYSNGLQFLGTYTFSKFIDNVDAIAGGDFGGTPGSGYQDFYNRQIDKALSPNDLTHNLTFNVIWDLPLGAGQRWVTSGPLSHIIGGWQLSVLSVIYSGPPYGVTTQTNTSETASAGPQRADILRDPALPSGQRSIDQWFDITAFAQPERFRFGNAARAVGRSPGSTNFDIGIMKNFYFRERFRIQFRGELFNAFNTPNFGNPGTTLDSPNFGVITSASAARVVQLGLKLYF